MSYFFFAWLGSLIFGSFERYSVPIILFLLDDNYNEISKGKGDFCLGNIREIHLPDLADSLPFL